jgi:hypothetical protein
MRGSLSAPLLPASHRPHEGVIGAKEAVMRNRATPMHGEWRHFPAIEL